MVRVPCICLTALAIVAMGIGPCGSKNRLTNKEAREALDEAALSVQAMSLISSSVEISTNFTIGKAARAAAEELQEFIESQLPCAQITLDDATLNIEYGALPGECTYNGNTYHGTHAVSIESARAGNLTVAHEWIDFTNGIVTVTGDANVTWSAENGSRRVVHELTWTRLSDGKTATGSGDRTQTALDGNVFVGIQVDGQREWTTQSDEWVLDIDNIEVRWEDPVPQSGSYSLETPFDITVSLSFNRVDSDTIAVAIKGGDKSFTFDVSQSGDVSD